MKQSDIKQVEESILSDIASRVIPCITVEFEDLRIPIMSSGIPFDEGIFRSITEDAYTDRCVNSYKDVDGSGLVGKISGFFKKIVRKMTCFYMEPVVQDQNVFNCEIVELMLMLCQKNESEGGRNKIIEEKIFSLEKRCSALEAENKKLKSQLENKGDNNGSN